MTAQSGESLEHVVQEFAFHDSGLPALEASHFIVREQLSKPYSLELKLVTPVASLDEAKLVGQPCTLTLSRAGLVRHINGIVAQATFHDVSADPQTSGGVLPSGAVELSVVPALTLLDQRINSRIFQNKKIPEILEAVLKPALADYGRKVTVKTSKAYQPLEYCTQFEESDLAFVERLMAEAGIMSYFVQGQKVEELVLFDDMHQYQTLPTLDGQKVPFATNIASEHAVETVSRFAFTTRLTSTKASARAFNWSGDARPADATSGGADALGHEREVYMAERGVRLGSLNGSGLYQTTNADAHVKLRQEIDRSAGGVGAGTSNLTGLSPGMTFDLENAMRPELDRKYLVVEVRHEAARPAASPGERSLAGDVAEVMYTNTFHCVPADALHYLPAPARRVVQTMQTATVVGDQDIATDEHGRIKVQFHWDRQGKNDINSSCWVRVAQASSGVGFGCVFIPRKGQEVVVSFLEGDPDKPLVIGSLYNGVNTPPYPLPQKRTRSVIRTRSTPNSQGYNEISFEDAKDSEELFVQAQKDMRAIVKHDHERYVANNEVLHVGDDSKGGKTDQGNRTRSVKNDETIDIGGNRTRTVKKDETVTIEGQRTETVKKDETLHVEANRTRTVTKDETVTVDGNRTKTVKKDETLNVGENLNHHVTGERTLTVGKDEHVTVSGAHDMTVTKAVTQTFKDAHTCHVTAHQELSAKSKTESISENYLLTTNKKFGLTQGQTQLDVSGNKVTLSAGSTVTIKRGNATITVADDGKTTINTSSGIVLKCGGSKIELTSSGITIKGGSTTGIH